MPRACSPRMRAISVLIPEMSSISFRRTCTSTPTDRLPTSWDVAPVRGGLPRSLASRPMRSPRRSHRESRICLVPRTCCPTTPSLVLQVSSTLPLPCVVVLTLGVSRVHSFRAGRIWVNPIVRALLGTLVPMDRVNTHSVLSSAMGVSVRRVTVRGRTTVNLPTMHIPARGVADRPNITLRKTASRETPGEALPMDAMMSSRVA